MKQQKDAGIAYLLWLLSIFGIAGIYYFYLDRPVKGIIWLLTFGIFGIGVIIDIFTLGNEVERQNLKITQDNVNTLNFLNSK